MRKREQLRPRRRAAISVVRFSFCFFSVNGVPCAAAIGWPLLHHLPFIMAHGMLLAINQTNPQNRLIQQVAGKLRAGAVICYPTDTGYGIGCDIFNAKAVKRIVLLKQRPDNKPFTFMCSNLTNISEYAHVSNTAYRLLRKCLPGPYTFVLPGTKLVPKLMLTRQKTVGIRVPANLICQLLIEALGNPIVNTSLPASDIPQTDATFVHDAIGNQVDLVIDGGIAYAEPSTVVDLTGDLPLVIRAGKGDLTPFQ